MEFKLHGARPAHRIITMIKWIRTSRLSIKNPHSLTDVRRHALGMSDTLTGGLVFKAQTFVLRSLRLKDLLGPVTRVKKKKKCQTR